MMFKMVQDLNERASRLELEYWLNEDLFSPHWWFIAILNLLFIVLLFVLIDRCRLMQMSIAFLISFILVGIVDELGYFFGLWTYPHQFITVLRSFNAVDFAVVPVMITLTYQYFRKWKNYVIANAAIFLFVSYIMIPLFVHYRLYILYKWNYTYSFLSLFVLCLVVKACSDWICRLAKNP
ncbi:CBO0543 family protein [Bacillus infantis]|uniref:CBO0543 family protein n=1 Tax=Bacillus infantis TaxID=324767 RepID=UPI002E887845|nr:hypothetical protein [Bacillus infantis]